MPLEIADIRRAGLFADLPEPDCAALASIAVRVRHTAGEMLFLAGDPSPGLYVLLSGRVRLSRLSPGGREQVIHIVEPGHHFNSAPVFDGGPCPVNAAAQTDIIALLFPGDRLRALILEHPVVALRLLADSCGYLRRLVDLVDDLALTTVQGRLARLLLTQAEAGERGVVQPLTQSEMAARLGTVREMVGRSLKTFEAMGLIRIERGTIIIIDRAALERESERG
ncbi:MAG: Crp/Fnr family transcriptional regulator [Roseiflexus castenholzii]|uniref:Crp/Fnr family transcriptional regulator n=1 Tax=Roseiflexus castenholzii TaxID=120962 RepID=UPI000CAD32DD|nr:MAG: Crp/Fnr family transcriptional regulator [Roseiflexus castenholzii]